MNIYLASDHAGHALKEQVKALLDTQGLHYTDLTPDFVDGDDYPDQAKRLAVHLKDNPSAFGIAFCGTGQGMCIALNRYSWVRAGQSQDQDILRLLKEHNHINVLCFAGRFQDAEQVFHDIQIVFDAIPDNDPRHLRRLNKLS